jgi:hypothetical protein
MHGKFLDAVAAMYESICMAVKVQGNLGTSFPTTQGTKQGGELSSLLFGLFIEQLHELFVARCPGMGPVLGRMRIPDLLYADDVAILAHDPQHIQQLLDVLHLFCRLFGMRVNLSKTFLVVYRNSKTLPASVARRTWLYAGQPVPLKDDFTYLGVSFHCTKGTNRAGDFLAKSGRRAMHALLTRLRQKHINQSAFQVRLFQVLVEPVLSYGCQVWAPDLFPKYLAPGATLKAAPEGVQLDFLRILSGLPRSVHSWTLLREFACRPLHSHWLALCARFWQRTLELPPTRPLRLALEGDVDLFRGGCDDCWAAKFLQAMAVLGLCPRAANMRSMSLRAIALLPLDEAKVVVGVHKYFDALWQGLPVDPATAESSKVMAATYLRWVRGGCTGDGAPHLHSFLARPLKTCLLRFRMGGRDLHIHTGRYRGLVRAERTCPACSSGEVEDLPHFLLRCPAYTAIRQRHPRIFAQCTHPSHFFAHEDQRAIATCLSDMLDKRQTTSPR